MTSSQAVHTGLPAPSFPSISAPSHAAEWRPTEQQSKDNREMDTCSALNLIPWSVSESHATVACTGLTDRHVGLHPPPLYLLHSGFHFSQVLPLKSCSSYLSSGLKSYGTDLQRSNPFLGRVLFHPGVLIIPQ